MVSEWFKDVYFKTNKGVIIQDDCMNVTQYIPNQSISLIYADLPFKMTQNSWDIPIPFEWQWKECNRLLKPDGVIAFHAMELFSALLLTSNTKQFKFEWYWEKDRGTGFLNAKKMPLRNIEEILIFSPAKLGQFTYNPQMVKGEKCHSRGKSVGKSQSDFSTNTNYGELIAVETEGDMKYPKTLLSFPRDKEKLHPTQKPIGLAEYIIKTHSNEEDIVLDITSGVCTSGLAAENTNRQWINIERDKDEKENCLGYCDKAVKRFK